VVNRTAAQSAAVSELLSSIFLADEPASAVEPTPPVEPATPGRFAGLDQMHGSLLRQLATRSFWSRAELADLADRHGLLPDGALDVINEMTLELTGEPVIEGDDELRVNNDVLREILR
jgi:hypothetical protein